MPTSKERIPEKARRVLGFLVSKGLLFADHIQPTPFAKIPIRDVFWVAKHVEPRVLEVFPAAYIHFPRSFIGHHDLPPRMLRTIRAIRLQEPSFPDYDGIRFKDMTRWAERDLRDRRTRPLRDLRCNKTLRMSPRAIRALADLATQSSRTETRVVEDLILSAAASATAGRPPT